MFLPILVLAAVQVSAAFDWTSSSSLANGTILPACPEQDVTLPWSFSPAAAEHVINIEWHFGQPGEEDTLLATQVLGNFLAMPSASLHVEFLPPAGLRLHNVAIADTGTYSVHVHVNLHGSVVTQVQSVDVHVSDAPITNDGHMHATIMADATFDNSTGQYHLQLACGAFKSEWEPKVSVLWRTPSNQTLSSTTSGNGRFLLSVPNPVTSGEYTCMVDDTSPASLCLSGDSPLRRGATVGVDGIQAQMVIMETRMKTNQQQITSLTQQLQSVVQDNAELRKQLAASLAASHHVAFHATLSRDLRVSHPHAVIPDSVLLNDGAGYNRASGMFSAPYTGTYFLLATAADYDSSSSSWSYMSLIANDTQLCQAKVDHVGGNGVPTSTCHAIVRLNAGEKAWLQAATSSVYFKADYTAFSGFLVYTD